MPASPVVKPRRDGSATKRKLLDAACCVFAEKGFRDATVGEICRRAGANPALISYHFGDKASLYEAVWRHCVRRARQYYPVDGGVDPGAPVEERLRAHIETFVRCMADSGELSHLHRLNLMESTSPNAFMSDVIKELRQPHTTYLWDLLREMLGPQATDRDIALCETTVVGQCRMARAGGGTRNPDLTKPLSPEDTATLAEHIADFTLAGIAALRARIDRRRRTPAARRKTRAKAATETQRITR